MGGRGQSAGIRIHTADFGSLLRIKNRVRGAWVQQYEGVVVLGAVILSDVAVVRDCSTVLGGRYKGLRREKQRT